MVCKFSYADSDSIVKTGEKINQIAGVDVSKYQGDVDWEALKKAGYIFAIIRAGYGQFSSQVDPYFVQNITTAIANGFDIGVYWFSYATSTADAEKEAALCYETIKPYIANINIGVFFDYEYDSVEYYYKKYETRPLQRLTKDMFLAFNNYLSMKNLKTGLYTNYDYINSYFKDLDYAKKEFLLWFADPSNKYRDNYDWDICQTGTVAIKGVVFDTNISQIDFNNKPGESFYTYIIKSGDTLSGIALQYGITLETLLSYNPQYKNNPNLIYAGEKVQIPVESTLIYNIGDKVKIKETAKFYFDTKITIPNRVKGVTYTISDVRDDKILIKEIYSWVAINDVEKAE